MMNFSFNCIKKLILELVNSARILSMGGGGGGRKKKKKKK